MEKLELDDFHEPLPGSLAIAVVMEKQPSTHPWADFRYDALGVVVRKDAEEASVTRIYQDGDTEHFLVTGLNLRMHVDECESYYHNLMSPNRVVLSSPASLTTTPRCRCPTWPR